MTMCPQSDPDCIRALCSDRSIPTFAALYREGYLRQAYVDRRTAGPDLADLIAAHQIHIAPYDAIVYARIGEREVGVKYSATGGDKAKAVRLAVREVLRLVGVTA